MLSRLFHFLWGDISREELKKFCLLGLGLLFTLMTYWMIRPIKDVLFLSLVGKSLLPYAKMASLAAIVVVLMQYSKLVDMFEKHRLVYLINSIIALFLCTIAIIIIRTPDIYTQFSFASKFLGWTAYIGSECSLVILYALMWSFVTSSMDIRTAKKGYPLIIAGAKLGAIAGPLLMLNAENIGISGLLMITAGCVTAAAIIIKFFTYIYPATPKEELLSKDKPTGALEGLRLFIKQPYLIGIFFLQLLPDIIGEILNMSMLFLAEESCHSPEKIAALLGTYGILVNAITFIFALFGTSLILRIWGVSTWLLLYPLIIAALITYTWLFYGLWTIIIVLALFKALRYAFTQPAQEIMFIPTSKDILFKSRSWISAFSTRSGQEIGSVLAIISSSMSSLAFCGPLISLGIIGLWLPVAWYVRKMNLKLVQSNQILS